MDSSTGGLNVEIKIKNTAGNLNLNYDPEATGKGDEPDLYLRALSISPTHI